MAKLHPVIKNISEHVERTPVLLYPGKKPFEPIEFQALLFLALKPEVYIADKVDPVFILITDGHVS